MQLHSSQLVSAVQIDFKSNKYFFYTYSFDNKFFSLSRMGVQLNLCSCSIYPKIFISSIGPFEFEENDKNSEVKFARVSNWNKI